MRSARLLSSSNSSSLNSTSRPPAHLTNEVSQARGRDHAEPPATCWPTAPRHRQSVGPGADTALALGAGRQHDPRVIGRQAGILGDGQGRCLLGAAGRAPRSSCGAHAGGPRRPGADRAVDGCLSRLEQRPEVRPVKYPCWGGDASPIGERAAAPRDDGEVR